MTQLSDKGNDHKSHEAGIQETGQDPVFTGSSHLNRAKDLLRGCDHASVTSNRDHTDSQRTDDDNRADEADDIDQAVQTHQGDHQTDAGHDKTTSQVGNAQILFHRSACAADHDDIDAEDNKGAKAVHCHAQALATVVLPHSSIAGEAVLPAVTHQGDTHPDVQDHGDNGRADTSPAKGSEELHDLLAGCEAGADTEGSVSAADLQDIFQDGLFVVLVHIVSSNLQITTKGTGNFLCLLLHIEHLLLGGNFRVLSGKSPRETSWPPLPEAVPSQREKAQENQRQAPRNSRRQLSTFIAKIQLFLSKFCNVSTNLPSFSSL